MSHFVHSTFALIVVRLMRTLIDSCRPALCKIPLSLVIRFVTSISVRALDCVIPGKFIAESNRL